MVDGSGELFFWDGFNWADDWKRARIYNYQDAVSTRLRRTKACAIDIHPWDRYGG